MRAHCSSSCQLSTVNPITAAFPSVEHIVNPRPFVRTIEGKDPGISKLLARSSDVQQIDPLCTVRPSTVKDDDELDDEDEDEDEEDDDDDIYDGVQ